MDIKEIRKVIDLLIETGVSEIEVRKGDSLIRVAAPMDNYYPDFPDLPTPPTPATPPVPTGNAPSVPANAIAIKAPMAGTFYRSPAPDMSPFVEVGQRVEIGDVLCIMESMKMMNEIKSERIGTIVGIAVENGQAIESGATIFYIN